MGLISLLLLIVAANGFGCTQTNERSTNGAVADGDTDADTDADADTDIDTDSDADADGDSDGDADTDSDVESAGDIDSDADGDSDTDSDTDTNIGSDLPEDSDTEQGIAGCAYECSEHCLSIGGTVMDGVCSQAGHKCCDLDDSDTELTDGDTDSDSDGDGDGDGDTDGDSDADTDSGTEVVISHDKFVGNITTGWPGSVDAGGLRYADYWDQITPENAGKWGSVEGGWGGKDWSTLDAIYAYCEENDVIFKQHAFVWGSQQPANAGSIGEAEVKAWMNEFCERYPNTKLIDVVNEPPPHTTPGYANNIGGGTNGDWAWVANSFKWAREACPNAILLLNDFNNIEWQNDNQHTIDIVTTIQAAGAPIDAVGAQAHDLDHGSVSLETVKGFIEKIHTETGLPVYITEMDPSTSDDNAQLALYQEFVPYFLESDIVPGVTIWGWIYGQTWHLAPESGLVRNGSSRAAMTWLMDTLGRQAP